ncbi:MAG: lipoyl(octanoyl) transferase LipB [Pseudomonadota bacterium]
MDHERPNFSNEPVAWRVSEGLVPYPDACAIMDKMVAEVQEGGQESVWLLEHPPLYTAGTSAKPKDLRADAAFPVFKSPRGGQYTYHGPGQRVAYLMLDLNRRTKDVRRFVHDAEDWIITALARLGVDSSPRPERVGVWVDRGEGQEDKIAALGVRLRRWVTFHGISVNVAPDLEHFGGIVPCGIADPRYGVTSLEDLGQPHDMATLDRALMESFEELFGPVVTAPAPTLALDEAV